MELARSARGLAAAPLPRRIAPLAWRQPALLWTPVAIVLALGWPALLFSGHGMLLRISLIGGGVGLALSIVALGGAWALGRPPRTRKTVIRNIAWTAAVIALAIPFLLMNLMPPSIGAQSMGPGAPLAMAPLALMVGLPSGLVAGAVFSLVALVKPARKAAA